MIISLMALILGTQNVSANDLMCATTTRQLDVRIPCVNVNDELYEVELSHYQIDSEENGQLNTWYVTSTKEISFNEFSENLLCATSTSQGIVSIPCVIVNDELFQVELSHYQIDSEENGQLNTWYVSSSDKVEEDTDKIEENIRLISAHFSDTNHLLILVGDKETVTDDMSCSSHDQELVAQMFASGYPHIIHLTPKEGLAKGASNAQYMDAPENIKTAINYVNNFSSLPGAVADNAPLWAFNFVDESKGIFNGACQDLGVHHLGLLEDGKGELAFDQSNMNKAGYGLETWNTLPIFANTPTCAEGGDCVVGDIGPGQGLVFLISGELRYEMAPNTWSGTNDRGFSICERDGCFWDSGQKNAAAYTGGDLGDWVVPSIPMLKAMFKLPLDTIQAQNYRFSGCIYGRYWASPQKTKNYANYVWYNGYEDYGMKGNNECVRAVRSF